MCSHAREAECLRWDRGKAVEIAWRELLGAFQEPRVARTFGGLEASDVQRQGVEVVRIGGADQRGHRGELGEAPHALVQQATRAQGRMRGAWGGQQTCHGRVLTFRVRECKVAGLTIRRCRPGVFSQPGSLSPSPFRPLLER